MLRTAPPRRPAAVALQPPAAAWVRLSTAWFSAKQAPRHPAAGPPGATAATKDGSRSTALWGVASPPNGSRFRSHAAAASPGAEDRAEARRKGRRKCTARLRAMGWPWPAGGRAAWVCAPVTGAGVQFFFQWPFRLLWLACRAGS
jgi:hypothetical protein